MKKAVHIYRRDRWDGKIKLAAIFEDIDQLAEYCYYGSCYHGKDTPGYKFGHSFQDRFEGHLYHWDLSKGVTRQESLFPWTMNYYCYVAYENDTSLVTRDRIVGAINKHGRELRARYNRRNTWNPGAKRNWHRGSSMRQMRTTQERRWAHAWDDEEFAPKIRSRRSFKGLPNAWDDYWRHSTKSWKDHRKTQWKQK